MRNALCVILFVVVENMSTVCKELDEMYVRARKDKESMRASINNFVFLLDFCCLFINSFLSYSTLHVAVCSTFRI